MRIMGAWVWAAPESAQPCCMRSTRILEPLMAGEACRECMRICEADGEMPHLCCWAQELQDDPKISGRVVMPALLHREIQRGKFDRGKCHFLHVGFFLAPLSSYQFATHSTGVSWSLVGRRAACGLVADWLRTGCGPVVG